MKKTNIVIIVVDAFRPKNLSLFGYNKETDKNIKKIAKENVLFRRFFSTSNSTTPALNSIFTGLYPSSHGVIHQFPYTSEEEIDKFETVKFWFPEYLKTKGYNTIAIDWIGMWFKRGFDYYEEKEEKESNLRKFMNMPLIKKLLLNLPNWAYKFGKGLVKTRASTPFVPCSESINLAISKVKQARNPFFLFVHLWDTHFPFPTTKYRASGEENVKEIIDNIKSVSQKEYVKKRITDINLNSVQDVINKYDLTIKNIDKEIGKFVKFLKKERLWENTIFIVLGDHGDNITEHGIYFSHSGLYDESIHVPLIMHLPGIEAKEINELAQNVDILPTILEYLKENTEEKFDGVSLLPLIIRGEKTRDKIFSWDGLSLDIKLVRTKDKKLIVAKNNTCNLCKSSHHKEIEEYDLLKDPQETRNIYSGESELMRFLK